GEAAVVGETAMAGVGVPGRHALFADGLADGLRPGRGIAVSHQFEGTNLSRPVARLAIVLEDAGDLLAVGDGLPFRRLLPRGRPAEGRAKDLGDRLRHRLAGQHVVDGLGQVVAGRPGPLDALAELVVDPAAVARGQAAVQDEGFRYALGPELVRDL